MIVTTSVLPASAAMSVPTPICCQKEKNKPT